MVEKQESNPLKALDILEGLAGNPDGITLTELCRATNLNKSSAYRILCALVDRGYVVRSRTDKTYSLGYKILSISSSVLSSMEIKKAARTALLHLSDLSNETIHLICRNGYEGIYIDKIDTPQEIGLKSVVGKRIPMYCTSGGKVILAFSTGAFVDEYLGRVKLEAHTKNTLVTKEALMEELANIRANGYALDNEEHNAGITCISVPVFTNARTIIAAVSISAPTYRFSVEKAKSFVHEMTRLSEKITKNLVY